MHLVLGDDTMKNGNCIVLRGNCKYSSDFVFNAFHYNVSRTPNDPRGSSGDFRECSTETETIEMSTSNTWQQIFHFTLSVHSCTGSWISMQLKYLKRWIIFPNDKDNGRNKIIQIVMEKASIYMYNQVACSESANIKIIITVSLNTPSCSASDSKFMTIIKGTLITLLKCPASKVCLHVTQATPIPHDLLSVEPFTQISPQSKWSQNFRRHFQMYFLYMNIRYFGSEFTEVCSLEPSWLISGRYWLHGNKHLREYNFKDEPEWYDIWGYACLTQWEIWIIFRFNSQTSLSNWWEK